MEELYRELMKKCIQLAIKAEGKKIWRPYVGALIIADGKIVGEGYKNIIDGTQLTIHAERMALSQGFGRYKKATLITTLEPCVPPPFQGKRVFSSCCNLIAESSIEKVVIGCVDNSPTVSNGVGIQYLKSKGIEIVRYTQLNDEICRKLMPLAYMKQVKCMS